jgi:nucleotide-binding universal stress UspA family protein
MTGRVPFKRLIVGVDFTLASTAAIGKACALAPHALIELVHVMGPDQLPRVSDDGEGVQKMVRELETEARHLLDDIAADLKESGSTVSTQLLWGQPDEELVKAGERADLVVLGAHPRGMLDRLALASVTEDVARLSRTPVLIVRGDAPDTPVGRILLALDPDDPRVHVIPTVTMLAQNAGVPLEVVHVIPRRVLSARRLLPFLEARAREAATRKITELFRSSPTPAPPVHVVFGSPVEELCALARPDDVIACVDKERHGLKRLIFRRSVTTKLLRTAPCSVLVLHEREPART